MPQGPYNLPVAVHQRLHTVAQLLLAYTVLVILWGAYVRVTGSGAGCADHWPLCDGQWIPRAQRVETLIEFTHRVTSGLAGLFALGLYVAAWRALPRGHDLRRAAFWGVVFMVVEGAVGAALVKLELVEDDASVMRAVAIAIHLANTFALLAAQVWCVHAAAGRPPLRLSGLLARPALLVALASMLVVGSSGAVTALGDTLFPAASLSEGMAADLSPTAHFLVRLRVLHPLLAVATAAFVAYAALSLRARVAGGLRTACGWLSALVFLQVLAGFVNLWLLAPAVMQILHLLLADAAWIALVSVCLLAAAERSQALAR